MDTEFVLFLCLIQNRRLTGILRNYANCFVQYKVIKNPKSDTFAPVFVYLESNFQIEKKLAKGEKNRHTYKHKNFLLLMQIFSVLVWNHIN